jgi:hypothetical protein
MNHTESPRAGLMRGSAGRRWLGARLGCGARANP